jgi:hypothetical protein
MPTPNQDVNNSVPSSSTEGQTVINQGQQPVETPVVQQTAIPDGQGQDQVTQSLPQMQSDSEALDQFGVPWKNRALENERKLKETVDNLPKLIEEQLSQRQAQQQQPTYTIEQLEAYAQENPSYRPWVEAQKAKIIQENVAKEFEKKFTEREQLTKVESIRRQAYHDVVTNYPDAFVKDSVGNLQFNHQSPIVQQMSIIMQDPRLKDMPDAISIAADIAWGRIARKQVSQVGKQVNSLQNTIKKVQRESMVEGGNNNDASQGVDDFGSALDSMKKSSTKRNEEAVVRAYLKKAGHI